MSKFLLRACAISSLALMQAAGLAACNMASDSYLSPAKIDIHQEKIHETMPLSAVDDETMSLIADHYIRHGVGTMDVTLTYGADENVDGAGARVRAVGDMLRDHGVRDVTLGTLPVGPGGHAGDVLFSYLSVTAAPPKDCAMMPADDRDQIAKNTDGQYPDYRFGCGVDSYIARQVARPKDLLGSDQMDAAFGDHFVARAKGYHTGADVKPLTGAAASQAK